MEFDKNLIEKSLRIWNFDVEQLYIKKIQHRKKETFIL